MSQLNVMIMGQSFALTCKEGEEGALLQAVRYLDQRMSAIRDAGRIKGNDRIAVIAAGYADGILRQGNKGVTLFFVISGFLIVTLLLRAKAARGSFSVRRFWGRRMCRILPVYYAVLALYVVAGAAVTAGGAHLRHYRSRRPARENRPDPALLPRVPKEGAGSTA